MSLDAKKGSIKSWCMSVPCIFNHATVDRCLYITHHGDRGGTKLISATWQDCYMVGSYVPTVVGSVHVSSWIRKNDLWIWRIGPMIQKRGPEGSFEQSSAWLLTIDYWLFQRLESYHCGCWCWWWCMHGCIIIDTEESNPYRPAPERLKDFQLEQCRHNLTSLYLAV